MLEDKSIPKGYKNKLMALWFEEMVINEDKDICLTKDEKFELSEHRSYHALLSSVIETKNRVFWELYTGVRNAKNANKSLLPNIDKAVLCEMLKNRIANLEQIFETPSQIIKNKEICDILVLKCVVKEGAKKHVYNVELTGNNMIALEDVLKDVFIKSEQDCSAAANKFYTQVFDVVWDYGRKIVEDMLDKKIAAVSQYEQPMGKVDKGILTLMRSIDNVFACREADVQDKEVGSMFLDENAETIKTLRDTINHYSLLRVALTQDSKIKDDPQLEDIRDDYATQFGRLKRMRERLFEEVTEDEQILSFKNK